MGISKPEIVRVGFKAPMSPKNMDRTKFVSLCPIESRIQSDSPLIATFTFYTNDPSVFFFEAFRRFNVPVEMSIDFGPLYVNDRSDDHLGPCTVFHSFPEGTAYGEFLVKSVKYDPVFVYEDVHKDYLDQVDENPSRYEKDGVPEKDRIYKHILTGDLKRKKCIGRTMTVVLVKRSEGALDFSK